MQMHGLLLCCDVFFEDISQTALMPTIRWLISPGCISKRPLEFLFTGANQFNLIFSFISPIDWYLLMNCSKCVELCNCKMLLCMCHVNASIMSPIPFGPFVGGSRLRNHSLLIVLFVYQIYFRTVLFTCLLGFLMSRIIVRWIRRAYNYTHHRKPEF